jgi:hypothetical protein
LRSAGRRSGHLSFARAAAPLLALALWLTGCRCQTQTFDQIFLLDANAQTVLSFDGSADLSGDAGIPSGASLDCTPAAAGCAPGGDCPAACQCVLTRDLSRSQVSIEKCTFLIGASPSVEIRYVVTYPGCGA